MNGFFPNQYKAEKPNNTLNKTYSSLKIKRKTSYLKLFRRAIDFENTK